MVNPGAFRGARKEFLMREKANYSAGVAGGYAADALAQIQRRYFKRFPIDLPHDEDPPAAILESIDDDAADPVPEVVEPDPQRLTIEEFAAALEQIEARRKLLHFRKGQIKRWLAYQHMKDNDIDSKESGAYNPYHTLLTRLTGKETHRDEIETELKRRLGELKGKRDKLAAERDRIAREMFAKLDLEEQRQWKLLAIEEHNELMKQYKKDLQLANTPSRAPEDRQRCIQGLVRFMQPILDMVTDCTGWTATFMAGGPEPAQDGQLNILRHVPLILMHSGTTTGDIKMNFGRAERERYKKYFVPIFGSYLQQCFTPEECRAQSLPKEEGYLPMSALEFDTDSVVLSPYDASVPQPPIGGINFPAAADRSRNNSSETSRVLNIPTFNPHVDPTPSDNIRVIRPSPASSAFTGQNGVGPRVTTPSGAPVRSPVPSQPPSPTPSRLPSPIRSLVLSPSIPSQALSPKLAFTQSLTLSQELGECQTLAQPLTPSQELVGECQTLESISVPPSVPSPPVEPLLPSQNISLSPVSPLSSGSPSPEGTVVSQTTSRSTVVASSGRCSMQSDCDNGSEAVTDTMVEESGHAQGKRRLRSSASCGDLIASNDQQTKRRKTTKDTSIVAPSTSATIAGPVQAPNDAPDWFKNALSMLNASDFGPEWQDLVGKWATFEAEEHYKQGPKLGNLHRPASIKDWIQRG
ncbi:hypothetical protein BDN70DRAFT_939316 [Pholiota conissans]|uniref:Uncharacterized protein n=1 Tax=Pholiota conissans TaxID=109636 RepID=A0A9P5YKT8_9AGAR|nr:hypothetical protein BDN70DRAFT_939316 [Pholiota conissans]